MLRARAILLVFEKLYSCLFIPNCTRNHVITYTVHREAKPIPVVTCTRAFPRALRELRVLASYSDWLTALFASLVIGQSTNNFGIGFPYVSCNRGRLAIMPEVCTHSQMIRMNSKVIHAIYVPHRCYAYLSHLACVAGAKRGREGEKNARLSPFPSPSPFNVCHAG